MTDIIQVMVVDDEAPARHRLKRLIEQISGYRVVAEAENGESALSLYHQHAPEIILLDIRMPGIDGMEVAQQLSQLDPAPAIIFCTAYDEYAIEAFKVNAESYLLKPVRSEALEQALSNARQLNRLHLTQVSTLDSPEIGEAQPSPCILVQGQSHSELIALEKIFFFRADQKYVTIVHEGGESVSDQTLKELETTYGDRLLRIHRNTLVNRLRMESLKKRADGQYQVLLRDCDHTLWVSRRHVSDVKNCLQQLAKT